MHGPDDELWDRLVELEMLGAEIEVEHDTVLFELHNRGWSWAELSARWAKCSPSQVSRRARAAALGHPVP